MGIDAGTLAALTLIPLIEEGQGLDNPYSIIVVDPDKRGVAGDLSHRFADFMVSARGQRIIRDFMVDGEPLFLPISDP